MATTQRDPAFPPLQNQVITPPKVKVFLDFLGARLIFNVRFLNIN